MTQAIRIAIIDSGINPLNPHVGNIAYGVTIEPDGESSSYIDQIGHGTAVAGVIHAKVPKAILVPVRVFRQTLISSLDVVLRAIDFCVRHEVDIINLSLGTSNQDHRLLFELAVRRIRAAGGIIVSALEINDSLALPGSLPGVIGVIANATVSPDELGIKQMHGKTVFSACPFPRDIPGVPRERNLRGVSFAVAHVTGEIARLWHAIERSSDRHEAAVRELSSRQPSLRVS